MSARQPFVPSRPASRAVNLSEETRAIAKDTFTHALSSTNNNASNSTSAEKKNSGSNHLDLEGSTNRPLNISSFKKSASRSTGSNGGANTTTDPGSDSSTAHNQNQNKNLAHGGGNGSTSLLGRSKSSGVNSRGTAPSPRIYAPRPFTPGPPAAGMTPQSSATVGFPAPEFKTPSLPFAAAKGTVEETAVAAQTRPSGQSHRINSSSSRHQSFFGGAHDQFSFDGPGGGNNNMDDDSGYYSSVSMSEQIENDDDDGAGGGDQLATSPMNRIQNRNGAAAASAFRRPPSTGINPAASVADEVPGQQVARGGMNARAGTVNPDFDASFANLTKRNRPASPEENEDLVLVGGRSHQSELSKRPCFRPSHNSSLRSPHDSLPRASVTPLDNVSCGETQTVSFPHNVPPPTATIEGFPGLEFSEADLERYAELYEKGTERWSRSTMDEWLAGANDIMTKFTEIMEMIKEHMSSKVNLYKSLHTKLANEHSSLERRANELRDASQALVRDSGNIGGGLDPNNLDKILYRS
ncbi:hypothetical protein BGY98DRAFT_962398 [Russula aff. rugulosa BPL654]|nr:hypothetical protein BGY98DRAFT_962398 [Russula aff. rugulosa BPL654]